MATLVYSDAGGGSERYQLRGSSILIGASAECAIRSGDPLLAAKHARLFERDGEYWIEDLGSQSGVFVGDQRVSQSRVAFGQVIVVGSLMIKLEDGQPGGSDLEPMQLLRMLAAAGDRQKQLEEERNALGARVGELHLRVAAAEKARDEAMAETVQVEDAQVVSENTLPLGEAPEGGLEKLAAELRAAEKARRDLETKINAAQKKRAKTHSEMAVAERAATEGDPDEVEIKQVQLLALNAQLAEADNSVERLRGQLQTRNQEIAAIRAKARSQATGPTTTKSYSVPVVESEDPEAEKRLRDLKGRFEAQFERAVTLQRKLKNTETRLAESKKAAELAVALETANDALKEKNDQLEGDVSSLRTKSDTLSGELEASVNEKAALADQLEELRNAPPSIDPAEIEALEKKSADLKVLLEGARRETSTWRGKLTAAKEEAKKEAARAQALEDELSSAAANSIEQAEQIAALGSKLEASQATAATKDRELTEMAAAVAISTEKDGEIKALTAKVKALQADLSNVRTALRKGESSKESALAARRELEAKALTTKSGMDELRAKLELAERRLGEAISARERAEAKLAEIQKELVAARDARLAAEEALAESGADPNRENTAVISLKRRLFENQSEAALEVERLTDRLREVETDLDRALDAEQAALARADSEAATVSAQIDRLTEERERLGRECTTVAAERDGLLRERDDLITERDELAAKAAKATKEAEKVGGKRTRLERDLKEAKEQLAAASARIDELEVTLEHASGVANETPDTEQHKVADDSDLQNNVVELASQNAQLSSELSELREQQTEAAEQITALRAELEKTSTLQSELEQANQDLTRRYEAVSEELSRDEPPPSGSDDLEALVRECQTLRARVADLEAEINFEATSTSQRLDTFSDLEGEPTAAAEPSPALVEWMNSLHGEFAQLKKQMRAASDEAAVMSGDSESIEIVNRALSDAVVRVEAARDALDEIAKLIGLA